MDTDGPEFLGQRGLQPAATPPRSNAVKRPEGRAPGAFFVFGLVGVHSWWIPANKNASNHQVEALSPAGFRTGLSVPSARRGKS